MSKHTKVLAVWTLAWLIVGVFIGIIIMIPKCKQSVIIVHQADSTSQRIIDDLRSKNAILESQKDE